MVIVLAVFIVVAAVYTAVHGLLTVTIIIAVLGIPGCATLTVMRAHSKRKLQTRDTIKHWDYAHGEPPEIIDHYKDK